MLKTMKSTFFIMLVFFKQKQFEKLLKFYFWFMFHSAHVFFLKKKSIKKENLKKTHRNINTINDTAYFKFVFVSVK